MPRFSLNVLTINTHKGFTAFNRRFILPELREAVRSVSADIVCLQEVMGAHEIHPLHIENWPDTTHYEFLADTMWSDYAYGRNAVYPEGHHGNAVLSRFPIEHYQNLDVSVGNSEKRGLLYCRIVPPESGIAIKAQAGLEEIFTRARGRPARTFPVSFPLLRLDRIYVKNAHASQPKALALKQWRHLSDHAPLSVEIHL